MVYKKDDWTLYKKEIPLKGGNQTIYFFSERTPKSGEQCDIPENMEVIINERTGLPYLKKI